MKVTVCLKYVPDLDSVDVNPLTGAVDKSRLLYLINPADESALALALQNRGEAGSVQGLTVGPKQSDKALRAALAAGASDVLRLWDEDWSEIEPFRTAVMLATALQKEALPDLILCGTKSVDRGSGLVPALLAEALGWPAVTEVTALDLQPGQATVQRRLERGVREVVAVRLPAVLALEPELARLPQASLPHLIAAQRANIPVQTPAELGLTQAELDFLTPTRQSILPPRPRPRPIFTPEGTQPAHDRIEQILSAGVTRDSGRILEGPATHMAEAIIEFLQEREFLESD